MRAWPTTLTAALLVPALAWAVPGTAARAGETITDDAGREVRVPARAERVACVTTFAVEYLMRLGHRPVLRPDIPAKRVRPKAARSIPTVAVDHGVGPNLEQLVAASPDLVISSPTYGRFTDEIERVTGAPVAVLRVRILGEVPRKARLFGELIGDPEAGEKLAKRLEKRIGRLEPPEDAAAPSVFAMFGSAESYYAFRPQSYLGTMVEHLGGEMITEGAPASETSRQLTPFSLEVLVERDPDVILTVRHGPPTADGKGLRGRDVWRDLRAVRNGRVHRLSQWRFMMNPGPSAIEALEKLRAVLYPDAGGGEDGDA